MEHHPHIHALVPGGGPALDGQRWIAAKHHDPNYRKQFLIDVVELGREFRKRFLRGLQRLAKQGKLKLEGRWSHLQDPAELAAWLKELEQTDWNVFSQGPPSGESQPQQVLKYLTRYLAGGPIRDSRLISDDGEWVHYWARSKDKRQNNRKRPHKLNGHEFVRRWALHILPKGFVRVRRYGGYHPTQSRKYLARCRELLPKPVQLQQPEKPLPADSGDSSDQRPCPICNTAMQLEHAQQRPSWKQVFEVEVYRSPSIFCPVIPLLRRGPPQSHTSGSHGLTQPNNSSP